MQEFGIGLSYTGLIFALDVLDNVIIIGTMINCFYVFLFCAKRKI